jgi:hypothetical protein
MRYHFKETGQIAEEQELDESQLPIAIASAVVFEKTGVHQYQIKKKNRVTGQIELSSDLKEAHFSPSFRSLSILLGDNTIRHFTTEGELVHTTTTSAPILTFRFCANGDLVYVTNESIIKLNQSDMISWKINHKMEMSDTSMSDCQDGYFRLLFKSRQNTHTTWVIDTFGNVLCEHTTSISHNAALFIRKKSLWISEDIGLGMMPIYKV